MNVCNIENAFRDKAKRNWHTLYVMVDAHSTIIRPDHNRIIFYDGALEVLKWFSDRSDFKLILWTSSHLNEVKAIIAACAENGIEIDFVNENPAEQNSERANFDRKFYFNIILDDKAGFEPESDWALVKSELIRIGEWKNTIMTKKTAENPAVKKRAIYVNKLPHDAPNFVGYGTTGFVISEPINNFVQFVTDYDRNFLANVDDLYFPTDAD